MTLDRHNLQISLEVDKIRPWQLVLLFSLLKMAEWFVFFKYIPHELTEFKAVAGLSLGDIFLPMDYKGTFRWCWSGFMLPYILRNIVSLFPFYLLLNGIIFVLARQFFKRFEVTEKGAWFSAFLLTNFYNFFILAVEDRALMFCFFYIYLLWHLITFLDGKLNFSWFFSLILLSFAFEQWIDVAVALILWCCFCIYYKKAKLYPFIFSYLLYLVIWIMARFILIGNLKEFQIPGGEQSFIFAYQYVGTGVEDFWHNILKYAHATFWTPWPFFGPAPLVAQMMKGPHLFSDVSLDSFFQEDFIYFNFLFSWYIYIGATAVLAIWLITKWKKGESPFSSHHLQGLFIFMWLLGSFTHWFIKFKPYLSLPYYYNYKAMTANVGALGVWGFLASSTSMAKGRIAIYWQRVWNKPVGWVAIIFILNVGMWWKAYDALAHHHLYDKYNSTKTRIWRSPPTEAKESYIP